MAGSASVPSTSNWTWSSLRRCIRRCFAVCLSTGCVGEICVELPDVVPKRRFCRLCQWLDLGFLFTSRLAIASAGDSCVSAEAEVSMQAGTDLFGVARGLASSSSSSEAAGIGMFGALP